MAGNTDSYFGKLIGDLQRGLQRTIVVSQLPADWKRYALAIGQYEVMSEACSGSLDAAIRVDFFAELDSATADQAAELDTARVVEDMDVPGYRLHPLKGRAKNRWSIEVSGNWRLTFEFKDGNAYVLDYEDYH